jgi:hypothetical protein
MSDTNQTPPEREFTDSEKKLLARLAAATESPYPLLETAADRTKAEQELQAELQSGCGEKCPKTKPAIAGAVISELNDDAGKPSGLVHLQLSTNCSACGRRVNRDFALRG